MLQFILSATVQKKALKEFEFYCMDFVCFHSYNIPGSVYFIVGFRNQIKFSFILAWDFYSYHKSEFVIKCAVHFLNREAGAENS